MSHSESKTTIEHLTNLSAMLAREGIDRSIADAESRMRQCDRFIKDKNCDDYSLRQLKEYKETIQQLNRLRAELHSQAFEAYKKENPDYAR